MKEIVNVKVTKTVEKEMEERQKGLRSKRTVLIRDMRSYWEDIAAVKRVEKMKENSDLLEYGGDLKTEESIRLVKRYESLNIVAKELEQKYASRVIGMIREIIKSEEDKNNGGKDRRPWRWGDSDDKEIQIDQISRDGVMVDEIIWSSRQLKTYLALLKDLGFTEIYYKNSSTNALEVISELIELGGVVYKSWVADERTKGVVIDIQGIELDKTVEEYMDEAYAEKLEEEAKKANRK